MNFHGLALLSALLLTSVCAASEFDLSRYPAASEAEGLFRVALLAAPSDREGSAPVFRSLAGNPEIPPDAVDFALSRYGTPEEAASARRRLVEAGRATPFWREALLALAASLEDSDHAGAAKLYETLFDAASGEWEKSLALGRLLKLHQGSGDREAARKAAVRLFLEYPARPEASAAEEYLSREGREPEAGLPFPALLERGRALVEGGSREKAVRTLAYVKKHGGKGYAANPALDLALGKALHFLRRYEEALPALSEALKRSKSADAVQSATFWKARTLFGLDRGNEGAPLLVKLAKRYPGAKKAPAWLYQAMRVFEGRAMAKEAGTARSQLLKGYPSSEEAAEIGFSQGWGKFREGKYSEAAKSFERYLQGGRRGWPNSRALYWASRAHSEAGEKVKADKLAARLAKEYPFGYYTRALKAASAENPAAAWVADPRGKGGKELKVRLPGPSDLTPSSPALARGAKYLRLGFAKEASAMLADEPGAAWLRYWAEDFDGALVASKGEWFDWPGDPEAPGGLFYPVAYPVSVMKAARESDVHPHFLLAIAHTESHFDPNAYSAWEARGLTQFIPDTARRTARALGIENWRDEMLYDPSTALRLGARHLRELLDRFDGDVAAAAAAYNAGESAVAKWRAKAKGEDPARFVEEIPYQETRKYVKKVLTAIDAYDRIGGDAPLWPR